jgi:hypothetical protein
MSLMTCYQDFNYWVKDLNTVISLGIINSDCYIYYSNYHCMNKTEIIEIMQWRTTRLAVLSVVCLGMIVFLAPGLIEEAEAAISARATSTVGDFYDIRWQMFEGRFFGTPVHIGPVLTWATIGTSTPWGGGNEVGRVIADIGERGTVVFHFNNPARGENTCRTQVLSGPYQATCTITQGIAATATFRVTSIAQENNNSYCDILNKLGSDQTKAIREKLRC